MTEKLFIKSKDKLLSLLALPEYEGLWGSVLLILKELMLASDDLNLIFTGFIEPYTNVFTQNMLKELTVESNQIIGQ